MRTLIHRIALTGIFLITIAGGTLMAQKNQTPVNIIFDTDMGPDYDDVGALAMLHAMADKGECRILATISSNTFKHTAAVLNILNTYFKRPGIPIGVLRGEGANIGAVQKWDSMLVTKYPHKIKDNAAAEEAVWLYRRLLANAPDKSVTIVTVGFFTNLRNLLQSPPDKFSSMTGKELVEKKLHQLVSMAGCFDHRMGDFKEFNVKIDAPASQYVFDHWPGKMVFSGFEIGANIFTGLPIVQNGPANSPVRDVFAWSIPLDPQDKNGRMSWDETAVLYAVRGAGNYFDLKEGRIISRPDGANSWDFSGKGHYFLVQKMPLPHITRELDTLIMHQPR